MLSLFPVFSLGCIPEESGEKPAAPLVSEPKTKVRVQLDADSGPWPLRRIDFFIYTDSATRPLEAFLSLTEPIPESAELELETGDKVVVALGNSPWDYRLEALSRYDAVEQLCMRYDEEDGNWPLLSAAGTFRAEEGARLHLSPAPLLCPVRIVSVDRNYVGDARIEDPHVYLERVNASAELLRLDGFRPVEVVDRDSPMHDPTLLEQPLPCDIGYFTQYPGTRLHCYPNDEEEASAGTPRTRLVLEGRLDGEICRWITELPPVRRGHGLNTEWIIGGPGSCTVRITDFLLYLYEYNQTNEGTHTSRVAGRVSRPVEGSRPFLPCGESSLLAGLWDLARGRPPQGFHPLGRRHRHHDAPRRL